jgi:hypothetical protein
MHGISLLRKGHSTRTGCYKHSAPTELFFSLSILPLFLGLRSLLLLSRFAPLLLLNVIAVHPGAVLSVILRFEEDVVGVFTRDNLYPGRHVFFRWPRLFGVS